ncbi:dyp-type peroxidase [Neopestalotiopsis clavispora]|nr:dyp-type peroxidase [Neopestalotiopsis clavispora]
MGGTQQPIQVTGSAEPISMSDLSHIQGDIVVGMAKKMENFVFFNITKEGRKDKAKSFREHLASFRPRITTAEQAQEFRELVDRTKERGRQPNKALNIAFSAKGLKLLGIEPKDIKDEPFNNGQLASAKDLGDDVTKWDPMFKDTSNTFEAQDGIHGVIIVVASDKDKLQEAMNDINTDFQLKNRQTASINISTIEGHVRAPEEGHEHFGFKDGITQPFLQGLDENKLEKTDTAKSIPPGVILLGRPGDPNMRGRPEWALDGSFLAFRKLEQRVPEFRADIQSLARDLNMDPELLGARLVGRWKNGGSVQMFPNQAPSQQEAQDPKKVQSVSFSIQDQKSCPFVAHIRKTNPRQDLEQFNIDNAVAPHRIFRRGIQYGPEVGKDETKTDPDPKSDKQRGLLFACYQSNITEGFEFIQKAWISNPTFPPDANVTRKTQPVPKNPHFRNLSGIDPLLGTPTVDSFRKVVGLDANARIPQTAIDALRSIVGANPSKLDAVTDLRGKDWVVSRGGEYFFSPSITALKKFFAS